MRACTGLGMIVMMAALTAPSSVLSNEPNWNVLVGPDGETMSLQAGTHAIDIESENEYCALVVWGADGSRRAAAAVYGNNGRASVSFTLAMPEVVTIAVKYSGTNPGCRHWLR